MKEFLKRRNIIVSCVALILIVGVIIMAISINSCSRHDHTFSDAWEKDEINHWHAATCEHKDEKSNEENHTFDSGVIKTQPTHLTNGEKVFTCTVCGYTKSEVIDALVDNHEFATTWTSDKDNHWHASTCGHDVKKDIAGHAFDLGVVTTNPTHTTEGEKTFTCSVCGYKKTEAVSALVDNHEFATTWTSDENNHWHATTCGHDLKKDTAGHSFDNGVRTTEPTCSRTGVMTYTCTVCDYKKTESIEINPDNHNYVLDNNQNCECGRNKYIYYDEESTPWLLDELNGLTELVIMGEKINESVDLYPEYSGAPSLTKITLNEGVKHAEINWCVSLETVNLPKSLEYIELAPQAAKDLTINYAGTIEEWKLVESYYELLGSTIICSDGEYHLHGFENTWQYDETNHWHNSNCGHDAINGFEQHSFDNGEVTTPATHTSPGVMTFRCTVCEYVKTEEIPQIAHSFTIQKYDENYHWMECECGEQQEKHDHIPGLQITSDKHTIYCADCNMVISEGLHTDITFTSYDEFYHYELCSICRHAVSEEAHYGNTISHDEENHWNVCDSCGSKYNIKAHSWDSTNQYCTECGYSIYIDYKISGYGSDIFYKVNGFKENVTATEIDLIIPGSYLGIPVKVIDMMAFQANDKLRSVKMLEGIVKIDELQFAGCSNLVAVYIPKSVTMYLAHCFRENPKLTDVYFDIDYNEWEELKVMLSYSGISAFDSGVKIHGTDFVETFN